MSSVIIPRRFEDNTFWVQAADDGAVRYLSYSQYKWLLHQTDPVILMYAPPGNNKRVLFRGTGMELDKLLRDNADKVAEIPVEDYIEYIPDEDGNPGDTPVGCSANGYWTLYVPSKWWVKVLERMRRVYPNWPKSKMDFRGELIPHCGESPQGLINLIRRICKVDIPDFKDLTNIPDPSDEDYLEMSKVDLTQRKLDEISFSLEQYFSALKRSAPKRFADLPDKVGR